MIVQGRGILDDQLKHLEFPMAQYERTVYDDNKICMTVIFQASKWSCNGSPVLMRISGVRSLDDSLAEHTVAVAAIRYLEGATNTVVKDLSYNRLKEVQDENMHLRNQLTDVKSQLKRANVRSKKLARGWFLAVKNMFSFSAQFSNVATLGNFSTEEIISDNISAYFGTICRTAQQLQSKSDQLETKLEEIRHS